MAAKLAPSKLGRWAASLNAARNRDSLQYNFAVTPTSFRKTLVDPKVQRHGDVAILSYNLVSYGKKDGADSVLARWNSTKVYARIEGQWKIVHDHWSYLKPELKTPAAN